MIGNSGLCDNCNSESDEGRKLINGKFLCAGCINKIKCVLDRSNLKNIEFTVFHKILGFIFLIGLLLAFITESPSLVAISAVACVLFLLYSKIQKRKYLQEKASIRDLNQYLDNWFDYPPDWKIRRKKVIERDNYRCTQCGASAGLQAHHTTSISNGGNHILENLKTLCVKCHSEMGGRHSQLINLQAHNSNWRKIGFVRKFSEHRAKKEYNCFICNNTIFSGDRYVLGKAWDNRYQICMICWNKKHRKR